MKRLVLLCAVLVSMPVAPRITQAEDVKFKSGLVERARHEYWRNIFDMNNQAKDNRNFFRFKTSAWAQADLENLSLYGKLTNEFKPYAYWGSTSTSLDKSANKKGYHFDINEIVVDNLYLDIKKLFDSGLDLRLGRQDFLGAYGEGFLIMDGTPQDGSRTFYFNAAKASLKMNDLDTLDAIYINDPRDEEFLPVINRVELERSATPALDRAVQALNTTDEEGFVLDWKTKRIENLLLESYYIYKTEAEEGGGTSMQSKKSDIHTFGLFEKYSSAPWTVRGQVAIQTGDYGPYDREAAGGYIFFDRDFTDSRWKPVASLGYAYLSGDDPDTDTVEGWNPLFSRYPWMSELYCLSYASETGVTSYWTNLHLLRASVALKTSEKTKLTFWYNFLRADQQLSAARRGTGTVFSGNGKDRGHLPQARFDYKVSENISTYFLAEYFIPDEFYTNNDHSMFLRTEVQVKF